MAGGGRHPFCLGRQPLCLGRQPFCLGRQPLCLGRQPLCLGRQPPCLGHCSTSQVSQILLSYSPNCLIALHSICASFSCKSCTANSDLVSMQAALRATAHKLLPTLLDLLDYFYLTSHPCLAKQAGIGPTAHSASSDWMCAAL